MKPISNTIKQKLQLFLNKCLKVIFRIFGPNTQQQSRSLDSHRGETHTEADRTEKIGVDRSYIEKEVRQYYKNGARVESPGLKKTWQNKKHVERHGPTGTKA